MKISAYKLLVDVCGNLGLVAVVDVVDGAVADSDDDEAVFVAAGLAGVVVVVNMTVGCASLSLTRFFEACRLALLSSSQVALVCWVSSSLVNLLSASSSDNAADESGSSLAVWLKSVRVSVSLAWLSEADADENVDV